MAMEENQFRWNGEPGSYCPRRASSTSREEKFTSAGRPPHRNYIHEKGLNEKFLPKALRISESFLPGRAMYNTTIRCLELLGPSPTGILAIAKIPHYVFETSRYPLIEEEVEKLLPWAKRAVFHHRGRPGPISSRQNINFDSAARPDIQTKLHGQRTFCLWRANYNPPRPSPGRV